MSNRAAIVTGASSGIGLAIVPGEEGHRRTVATRRPDKPGFVDTPMTEFAHEQVVPEQMIRTQDIAEAVRLLLRLSSHCVVPELVFQRTAESL
jgi:NADP-dependent 3-hydroxy acid dehydrogenase YdfG